MKNFVIEINGQFVKDYQNSVSAYKYYLLKARNKNNLVSLYELKSHALNLASSITDNYVLIESNNNN